MIIRNRREARERVDRQLDQLSQVSPEDVLHRKRRQILHVLESAFDEFVDGQLTVRSIMTHSVTTCRSNDRADDILKKMKTKRIRQVIVCDMNHEMIGILSRTDIASGDRAPAHELMSSEPICVHPETPITQALHAFLHQGISSLPVTTNEGAVCGLVTKTDALMILECVQMTLADHKDELSIVANS